VQSPLSAIMYGINLMRQFTIILIAVVSDFSLLQITVALYLQEIYTMYQFKEKPMKEPWRDYVEYFNESVLFLQTIWMCTLTDFVPSAWTRYYVSGWVMIYLMYV
jgi:hypothetical protein